MPRNISGESGGGSAACQTYRYSYTTASPTTLGNPTVDPIASLYTEDALVKQFPYLPTLQKSIETAVPRPVTPFYPAVTEAVQTNAYAALQGQTPTATALKSMNDAIASATAGG